MWLLPPLSASSLSSMSRSNLNCSARYSANSRSLSLYRYDPLSFHPHFGSCSIRELLLLLGTELSQLGVVSSLSVRKILALLNYFVLDANGNPSFNGYESSRASCYEHGAREAKCSKTRLDAPPQDCTATFAVLANVSALQYILEEFLIIHQLSFSLMALFWDDFAPC
jgi:hypothetical protein